MELSSFGRRISAIIILGSAVSFGLPRERPEDLQDPVTSANVPTGRIRGVVDPPAFNNDQSTIIGSVASELGLEATVVKGAPLSAEIDCEFLHTLGNGQSVRRKENASFYRDSEGRTRREQPRDTSGSLALSVSHTKVVRISDPGASTSWILDPVSHAAIVHKPVSLFATGQLGVLGVFGRPQASGDSPESVAGSQAATAAGGTEGSARSAVAAVISSAHSSSNLRTEPLGTKEIGGVQAEGTRTIETIPTGTVGNDSPIEIVTDRWYSREFGVVVRFERTDPMSGNLVYGLNNIRPGEPSPQLFQIPADYRVIESPDDRIRTRR